MRKDKIGQVLLPGDDIFPVSNCRPENRGAGGAGSNFGYRVSKPENPVPGFRFQIPEVILLMLLSLFCCKNSFALTSFGDIDVNIQARTEGESFHGYYDYRIYLKNHSPLRSYEVEILFAGKNKPARNSVIREMRRHVSISPSAEIHFSVMLPPLRLWADTAYISIDGARQLPSLPLPHTPHMPYGKRKICLLVSPSLNRDDLLRSLEKTDELKKKTKSKSSASDTENYISLIRAQSPPAFWPENWMSYSPYDGIIMTAADMDALSPASASALLAYVKCGGSLSILGDYKFTDIYGEKDGNKHVYYAGFGQCTVFPLTSAAELDTVQMNALYRIWKQVQQPWYKFDTPASANLALPVSGDAEINIRGFFLGMFLFVIIVGPLNFFVLSLKKKKILLIWTIPAISLFTCTAVFLYAVFSEGLDSDVRISAFTILDQSKHEAVTLGLAGYYCRMTPGRGLHFSRQTEVSPVVSNLYGEGNPRTLDWTRDQHLESGWITARVPAHFQLRKYEKRRERLEMRFGSEPSVLNGLGADIRKLLIYNRQGRMMYSAGPVPAGKRGSLKRSSRGERGSLKSNSRGERGSLKSNSRRKRTHPYFQRLRSVYRGFSWKESDIIKGRVAVFDSYSYIAIMEGNPFLEKGLEEPDNLKEETIVFGIMEK